MDEWNIGDICFIIANKAKGYVYPYKILSISENGYYHIQSEITGMRHNVSPSRMFHSKEEALQSLGFPAHAEQDMVYKNSIDTESDDRQSPVEAVDGIGALICDRETAYSRNVDPDVAPSRGVHDNEFETTQVTTSQESLTGPVMGM